MTAQWQTELADAVSDPAELIRILELDPALTSAAHAATRQFPLRVPRSFVARMRKGNSRDPLLRQVLPLGEELKQHPGFSADPVGDLQSRAHPGVLQKYQGRALLITTGACGIHCRYCFRRHFPYAEETARAAGWRHALDYLRGDTSVREVILSGGDPLSLNDRLLAELAAALEQIRHIKILRIHTRQPVVLPSRVDATLLRWLTACRLQKVVVLHANHAQELDEAVRDACAKLRQTGAILLNQSVLLRGVNDTVEALAQLSEALLDAGVIPYYLHMLDRVQGAAHFDVPDGAARRLMGRLRGRLPGYLVPRLVREVPGAPAKLPLEKDAELAPAVF